MPVLRGVVRGKKGERVSRVGSFTLAVGVAFSSVLFAGCPTGTPGNIGSAATCLACHNGRVAEDMRYHLIGNHRLIACATCHIGSEAHVQAGGVGGGLINPANWPIEELAAVCAQCHRKEVKGFLQSRHAAVRIACDRCHDVHAPVRTRGPYENNLLCQSCHLFDWPTEAAVEAHTNHPVDPAGTGASRCVGCHMPAQTRSDEPGQEDRLHSHTWMPIPPITSANQAADGETVLPNSCAGTAGCHDGSVAAAPIFNIDDPVEMTGLQALYDFFYPEKVGGASGP
ncbi:MAG: hypothetical protein HUU46_14145 [Candidatus Hydrogenedentes bacterium]|nr:hypothetical protein [Candidatus Hydrogenedentota bacterium]